MCLMIMHFISETVRPVTGKLAPLSLTRDDPLTPMTATPKAMPINKLY
jgi:hypothetical protein